MKTKVFSYFFISIAIFIGSFEFSEAKSVLWNYSHSGSFGGGNNLGGISNPNFSVVFNAQIRNIDNGSLILDGSVVPVGTRIRFEYIPVVNQDFSFFGTGFHSDSPYGFWSDDGFNSVYDVFVNHNLNTSFWAGEEDISEYNAAMKEIFPNIINYPIGSYDANECSEISWCAGMSPSNGFYGTDDSTNAGFFVTKKPNVNVLKSGTAGISCDTSGINCTIISLGTINANFNFSESRIESIEIPEGPGLGALLGGYYLTEVPTQTIPFSFTAVSSNNSPATPSLPCTTTTGYVGSTYNFTATSTDPDGDTIRYGFDLDNDGVVNQWAPLSGYVNSGISQTFPYSWTTTGIKTIKVLAQDSKGSNSAWSPACNITINPGPSFTFTSSTASIPKGSSLNLNWTPSNSNWCWATSSNPNNDGGWTTTADGDPNGDWKDFANGSYTKTITPTVSGLTTYYLQCGNSVIPAIAPQQSKIINVTCTPTYDYVCSKSPLTVDCNALCGQTVTKTARCTQIDTTCGNPQTDVALSNCTSCANETVPCGACPSSAGIDGYKEVRP